jgi:hypothetical protein
MVVLRWFLPMFTELYGLGRPGVVLTDTVVFLLCKVGGAGLGP